MRTTTTTSFVVSELIDTTENLPLAVASFARWLTFPNTYYPSSSHAPLEFDFLLVTEDTSFIALDQLLPKLRFPSSSGDIASFRSKFAYFEHVKYFGNGIVESNYVSQTYPPLPSISGSILSRDLVQYLAALANSQSLKSFAASLSASLTIWLAPATPNYVDDAFWSSSNVSCSSAVIAAGPFYGQKCHDQCLEQLSRMWKDMLMLVMEEHKKINNYLRCSLIFKIFGSQNLGGINYSTNLE